MLTRIDRHADALTVRSELVLGLCAALLGSAGNALAFPPGVVASSRWIDNSTRADANYVDMFVTNHGALAYDLINGASGLIFPRGTGRTAVYAAGLWMGALVDGQPRVTVAEYSQEFSPGKILSETEWDDPNDPRYHVYKIAPGDTDANPDYANWPDGDGAPTDPNGDPRSLGHQTLWAVYNDLDPAMHTNDAGSSDPLGIEVQQTAFALDLPGLASNAVYLEWKILNKGGHSLGSARVSLWCDPDLGGAADDLVGCDPALDLGYCYNATNQDEQYGATPPSFGFQLVQGPIVPSPGDVALVNGESIPDYRNLAISAFARYINGTDPGSTMESWNYMRGLYPDGSPVIDPTNGQITTFMMSGDPINGTGWIDDNPSDRRFMLSVGPFDMAPGDVQVIGAVMLMGQGSGRLASITSLKQQAAVLPGLFQSIYADETGACCIDDGSCVVTRAFECRGYFAPGETCDGNACAVAVGACCFDNGTCLRMPEAQCTGTFGGASSLCGPEACGDSGPIGACCLPGGCQELSELNCLSVGGSFQTGASCAPERAGQEPGWRHNLDDGLMLDEVAGPGGVTVPPDGLGGPGNAVWHDANSTNRWWISASGGDGGITRFTRGGSDEKNLTDADVILRWDNDPDNLGCWDFDDATIAPIPFGLYERDAVTGEETRLIPVLFSLGGTVGIFDYSDSQADPWSLAPATDAVYGFRLIGSYQDFLADARDNGVLDVTEYGPELFARMIFASDNQRMPLAGTVVQFSTKAVGPSAGSGFDHAVPLAWTAPPLACGSAVYDVYRDGALLGTSDRADYIDRSGLVVGQAYGYSVVTRDPMTNESAEMSTTIVAVPSVGYAIESPRSVAPPVLDGHVGTSEWAWATVLDASPADLPSAAAVLVMNDASSLYIAIKDRAYAKNLVINFDANSNGAYDGPEGAIWIEEFLDIRFEQWVGAYPDVQFVQWTDSPTWVSAATSEHEAEIKIDLTTGPFASRPPSNVVGLAVRAWSGWATYPPAPKAMLWSAPELFARTHLAPLGGPPAASILPPAAPRRGAELEIKAAVAAEGTPSAVTCLYRSGSAAWSQVAMQGADPPYYVARIPGQGLMASEVLVAVEVTDGEGRTTRTDPLEVTLAAPADVPESAPAISFANPVRGHATIQYRVDAAQSVSVVIVDVGGRVVRELARQAPVASGVHTLDWDCRDERARLVPAGSYFCRIEAGGRRETRRLTVVR